MELLFNFSKDKKTKNDSSFFSEISMYRSDININIISTFNLMYYSYGGTRKVDYNHVLTLNLKTGDFDVINRFTAHTPNNLNKLSTNTKNKKNDFHELFLLTNDGLILGQRGSSFWGVVYERNIKKLFNILYEIIKSEFNTDFYKTKEYTTPIVNSFYDLIVDYHLDKKNIKGYDGVYHQISKIQPKKKWLKLNENKYLPAVLDSFSIKTNYFISEINKNPNKIVNISSLKFLCNLFGDNFIDYIKNVNWIEHCDVEPPTKKTFQLKNESEKKNLVSLINDWEKTTVLHHSLIYKLHKLFNLREKIEKKGYGDIKFKVKDTETFINTQHSWGDFLEYTKIGYRLKYVFTDEFLSTIERDIEIDGKIFKPIILKTEEDFKKEGFFMKNCMGNLFNGGSSNIFISLRHDSKRIDLQYRSGNLLSSYGKANSEVPQDFIPAVMVLNRRVKTMGEQKWNKEKYDVVL